MTAKSVRDAMTADPRSIGASASVVEAALLMLPPSSSWRSDGVGSKVDAGGSGIQRGSRSDRVVQYPVARSAVSTVISPVPELRGIRVPRALALPEVEDAGRSCAPSRPRSSSGTKGCRPPATPGRTRSGHRRGPERCAAGSPPTVLPRSAWSARAATTALDWPRRPSVSIALRSFWLIARTSAGLVAGS
jgi:hypothetical protein